MLPSTCILDLNLLITFDNYYIPQVCNKTRFSFVFSSPSLSFTLVLALLVSSIYHQTLQNTVFQSVLNVWLWISIKCCCSPEGWWVHIIHNMVPSTSTGTNKKTCGCAQGNCALGIRKSVSRHPKATHLQKGICLFHVSCIICINHLSSCFCILVKSIVCLTYSSNKDSPYIYIYICIIAVVWE